MWPVVWIYVKANANICSKWQLSKVRQKACWHREASDKINCTSGHCCAYFQTVCSQRTDCRHIKKFMVMLSIIQKKKKRQKKLCEEWKMRSWERSCGIFSHLSTTGQSLSKLGVIDTVSVGKLQKLSDAAVPVLMWGEEISGAVLRYEKQQCGTKCTVFVLCKIGF